jgi:hypothetical protein
MTLLGNIDAIRQAFFKDKFVREFENIEQEIKDIVISTDNTDNWLVARFNNLQTIISDIDGSVEQTKKIYEAKQHKLSNDLDELSQLVYKKSWTRLPIYHKTVKIEEFVKSVIPEKTHHVMQKEMIVMLTDMVDNRKLNSIKNVEYDSKNCRIIGINGLTIDLPNKEYKMA